MIVQPDNHQLRAGLANRRATEVSNYKNVVFASYDNIKINGCIGFFVFSRLKMQHRGSLFGMYD